MGAYARPRPTESWAMRHLTTGSWYPLSTGSEIPHLDEKFIHKCLNDLKALGMIDDRGFCKGRAQGRRLYKGALYAFNSDQ